MDTGTKSGRKPGGKAVVMQKKNPFCCVLLQSTLVPYTLDMKNAPCVEIDAQMHYNCHYNYRSSSSSRKTVSQSFLENTAGNRRELLNNLGFFVTCAHIDFPPLFFLTFCIPPPNISLTELLCFCC